ncbi:Tubulin-tyrosine ligase family protein [Tritrichomonas foetus]|uniref:Tubulin--tyrosine ligase-like protein 5 n=1 Tax=Tritrichomonas foetus TaxID=1144522 RepID=A0A1J4K557_9EUKA|nr:Tubulin-tyrosine ligase family protein [Tritrichomonas foetus]|eukprot:OHT06114.1 Tubulin-tyrosine ligase family protein [Tritrichomonas foetus]
MQQISQFFAAMPLPFSYLKIPLENEPRTSYKNKLYYHVEHKVITSLTREAFFHCGLHLTTGENWIVSWGRQLEPEQYRQVKSYQKINHFVGAYFIGRKDELHKRMRELKENGFNVDFYPESYLLYDDFNTLVNAWMNHKIWIIKPPAMSRGRGIKLYQSDTLPPDEEGLLVQEYISKPLIIGERKFDIRIYVFVPSIMPLRVYIHKNGLAKFCTHKYNEHGSYDDSRAHLTNFSLNKEDLNFNRCSNGQNEEISDSKWSLDFLMEYLKNERHCDTEKMMKDIERICIATLISSSNLLRPIQRRYESHRTMSYELYGFDILFDQNLHAYLMEVNISPSLSGADSELDQSIKFPVNLDVLRLAKIVKPDMREIKQYNPYISLDIFNQHYSESITPERRKAIENGRINPWDDPVFADFVIIREYIDEQNAPSGFRLIYPLHETADNYKECFGKTMCYEDIVFYQWIKMDSEKQLRVFKSKLGVYASHINPIKEEIMKYRENEKKINNEEQERLVADGKTNNSNFTHLITTEIHVSQTVNQKPKERCKSVPIQPRKSMFDFFV